MSISQYSDRQILDYLACKEDPSYFVASYFKAQNRHGLDYAYVNTINRVAAFHAGTYSIHKDERQSGTSTAICAYALWTAIFKKESVVALVSDRFNCATELLYKIRYAYDRLPDFLKVGITTNNKERIEFENGSLIRFLSSESMHIAIRGYSVDLLCWDNAGYIKPSTAQEAFLNAIPSLTYSGGKCVVTWSEDSNGYPCWNYFHDILAGATLGDSKFVVVPPMGRLGAPKA